MSEQYKALIRKGFEAMNSGNLNVFDEILSPEYKNYTMPMHTPGAEGMKQVLTMFRTAFPDFHLVAEQIFGEGDRVASQGYWTGTQQGEFMGIPATGKQVKVGYIDVWHFVDGKAVENWVQMDNVGLMQQLGVIPAPGA